MAEVEKRGIDGSQRPPEMMAGPFLEFDLRVQIDMLRQEEPYQRGRNSKTLSKYQDFRVVLSVLKAGAHMKEHAASSRISVQTVSGHLRMHVGDRLLDLPAGRLLVLDHGVPHDVEAVEDSAFLLTLGSPTSNH